MVQRGFPASRWLLGATEAVVRGVWAGAWLGALRRQALQQIGTKSYQTSAFYASPAHNTSGLFPWEAQALKRFFDGARRILLLGAGAGRELISLVDMGFAVDAFECNVKLREAGNVILGELGKGATILPMEPDRCPVFTERQVYDGVILGWGMYTLVQGRDVRMRLLHDLRDMVPSGAPLLVSFLGSSSYSREQQIAHRIASALRIFVHGDELELGDFVLRSGYVHYFTEVSIVEELAEESWKVACLHWDPYPHVVAVAA